MFAIRAFSAAVAALLLASCATTGGTPSRPLDACAMVRENDGWGKALGKSARKWGVRAGLMLAFIYQESGFRQNARPARKDGFLFIPGKRPSDAFGYAQAKTDTWEQYKKNGGGALARRDSFADATDFVGWYVVQTESRTGVNRNDAVRQYLAYHEGAGGYLRGTYRGKQWLMSTADQVGRNAASYEKQLSRCASELQSGGFLDNLLPF